MVKIYKQHATSYSKAAKTKMTDILTKLSNKAILYHCMNSNKMSFNNHFTVILLYWYQGNLIL